MLRKYTLISSTLLLSRLLLPVSGEELTNREEIITVVEKLSEEHDKIGKELAHLKTLIGYGSLLDTMNLIPATDDMPQAVKTWTKEGSTAFQEKRYEDAKNLLQSAWESEFNNYITNFNLGMAYYKLGKAPLAKRMLKTALELKKDIKDASLIAQFVNFKEEEGSKEKKDKDQDKLSPEEELAKTELLNLKKETESYLKSLQIPLPIRITSIIESLIKIQNKAKEHKLLIQEFYPFVSETYSTFEWYEEALSSLKEYEKSMKGKVLPNEYHTQKLQYEENQKKQQKILTKYTDNTITSEIQYKLNRDLRELEIFSAQMEEFVPSTEKDDSDFKKICQRLREYRWGNQQNRHVIVWPPEAC